MRKDELLQKLREMGFEVAEYDSLQHLGKHHITIVWQVNRDVITEHTLLVYGANPVISAVEIGEIKKKFRRYCPAVIKL